MRRNGAGGGVWGLWVGRRGVAAGAREEGVEMVVVMGGEDGFVVAVVGVALALQRAIAPRRALGGLGCMERRGLRRRGGTSLDCCCCCCSRDDDGDGVLLQRC